MSCHKFKESDSFAEEAIVSNKQDMDGRFEDTISTEKNTTNINEKQLDLPF